jgi:hypothetical protein
MLDELSRNSSYSSFFAECAANLCTYSIEGRKNIIIVVTSLIGVFSGLSVALQLATPFVVQVYDACLQHVNGRQNKKHSSSPAMQS